MRFVVLLLLPALASADDQPHITAGLEIAIGRDITALAARVHAGGSHAFGEGRVRPSIGVGLTLAAGRLEPEQAKDASFFEWGPVLQLGVDIGDNELVTNRVFAIAGYAEGWRLGIGYNLAQFCRPRGARARSRRAARRDAAAARGHVVARAHRRDVLVRDLSYFARGRSTTDCLITEPGVVFTPNVSGTMPGARISTR
jgi:hypothetical protein